MISQRVFSLKRKVREGQSRRHRSEGEGVSFLSAQAVESVEEEEESYLLCKARLDHLKSYASGEQTDGMKNAWRQTRIDRMLVDHFLRAGYYTAAQKLTESSGIEVRRAANGVNRRKMGACPHCTPE